METIVYKKKTREQLIAGFKESIRRKKEWLSENNLVEFDGFSTSASIA